ncbi:hypothetical protein HAZT_HAZT005433 [Hyalella azteca]|uniref:chitinase n=1 Tax=Hyalella azteca TaxID=294128 RepID=A0A6A0H713_HYAAZ|nr:hypothetical protein HAZT_HAZT005433 [Hyalella azteca]
MFVEGTRETDVSTPSTEPSVATQTRVTTQPSLTTMSLSCSPEGSYQHDPSDCSSYYLCVHGSLNRFTCQSPLLWNKIKNICDWPKSVNCQITDGGGGGASAPSSGVTSSDVPQVTTPPPAPVELEPVQGEGSLSKDYMVVCYFTNWAWYRPGIGKYTPDDIDPTICTHIVYGFAVLDYSNLIIKPHDSWADLDNNFYGKVTALKKRGIKVTVAIGGWNDSAGDKYSRLVNNPTARRKFIEHVIEFITKHDFDGLDLDWEYPKCWQVDCNKGPATDKQAFADWVRELSEAFKPRGLLLSAAVSPSKKVIDEGYDVPALNRYLDWIAVMTYDYHGQWDKKTGHVAPMYYHPEDDIDYFNMDFTIRYWLEQGATLDKLVLGMPMYGQSFTLNNPSVNGLNAPARSGGTAGEFTRAKGFLAYYEICDRVRNGGWTVVKDPEGRMGPYAYSGDQWVSYDDVETIRKKAQYIRDKGLAGGMVWALDLDDFRNRCGQGAHPLMNTIKSVLGE